MAGDWQETTLGEFCKKPRGGIQTGPFGSQLHRSDYLDDGIPVIMPTNIRNGRIADNGIARISETMANKLKRHRVKLGDIIFSRRGEVDKCAVITEREVGWLCGTGCLLARVDPILADPRYISYHISERSTRDWLNQNAVGLVMPNLNTDILKRIPLRTPTRDGQEKVADLLVSLDAKIDLNGQLAATLETMAITLFKNWFVDFDPVHAKAERRDTRLPADIADLFPNSFGDDGLPSGWCKESLLKHATLISGGTPKTDQPSYWDGDIPWASAKDVSQCPDRFLISTERTITHLGMEESSTRSVPAYSTVFVARGATTGRYRLLGIDMAMNQTCYALNSTEGNHFWLTCTFANSIEKIVISAHGSAFDTITTTTLANASIVAGTSELRSAFEALVRPMYLKILGTVEAATRLSKLRNQILPKLLSGDIRIADAAHAVAAA